MKLKKLLALALAGAVLTASLTACTPLDAAELVYDSIFGGGSSSTGSTGSTAEDAENSAVAEGVADRFMKSSPNAVVSYGVPELTSTIQAQVHPGLVPEERGEGHLPGPGALHRLRSDAGRLPGKQPEGLREAEQFRGLFSLRLHRDERR